MSEELKNSVMEAIDKGQVKMRDKSYFIRASILKAIGITIAFVFTLFLISFVIFYLQYTGAWYLSRFGAGGLRDLLLSLPWIVIFLSMILVGGLIWYSERYPISYKQPLIYSLLTIVCIVVVGSIAVAATPLHKYFFQTFGGPMNHGAMHGMYGMRQGMSLHNGVAGRVIIVYPPNSFDIDAPGHERFKVEYDNHTVFNPDNEIEVGDFVLVRGRVDDEIIHADGIRDIPAPY